MSPVDSFIIDLSPPQQKIASYLNQLILSHPGITSKIRYRIPFYFRKSWICYINPIKGDGIELAFTRANELSNENGHLAFNGRKQVAGIKIFDLNLVREEIILGILNEAVLLDEKYPYAAKRRKK